jgi:hypothetical protein
MKYQVERKAPGDAGYIKIADVTPQTGTVLTNHSYQFNNVISNVNTGLISYRIRQIIDTATATLTAVYIDTASVNLTTNCSSSSVTGELFKVQGTPTTGNASLIVQTSNAITNMPITIYDIKGSLVMRLNSSKATGKAKIDLPVSVLAAGKYFVNIYDNNKLIGKTEFLKL